MVRGNIKLSQDVMVVGERSWRGKDRHEVAERQTSPKRIREVSCYMCQQLEHMKRDYPRRKREKGEGSRSKSSNAVAESNKSDDLLMLSARHREEADQWILNSASSYHCTPHRVLFASYT